MVSTESRVLSYLSSTINIGNLNAVYRQTLQHAPEEALYTFVRFVYFEFKNNPFADSEFNEFLQAVHLSGYSLPEWLERMNYVYAWLLKNNMRAKFSDIVQYVSCYFESNSADSIAIFLDIFGFERACGL